MGEQANDTGPDKRKWRKKRKNFLSNAKKYGKKGQVGRGTQISDELYQYFVGILDALKKGITDEDERMALVNNVLERTKGIEADIVSNQLGSRVIEILLPHSSPADFERFINTLSPDLRKLCSDNFTSHVVETLLRVACNRATDHLQSEPSEEPVPKKKQKIDKKYTDEHVQICYEFTLKVCKYALNNLEDFVWDSYANHILRSAIKCLSGITLLPGEKVNRVFSVKGVNTKGIPPHITKLTYRVVPDEFKELVKEFAHRLSSWPQFKDLPNKNITSALLQVLLYAIKNVDKQTTRDLIKKLINESFAPEDWVPDHQSDHKLKKKIKQEPGEEVDVKEDIKLEVIDDGEGKQNEDSRWSEGLPPVFHSQASIRLLEVALFVAKKKTYTLIYARCFINRLARLATLPMLNYTVQRLIDSCNVKEEFEPMFDELTEEFSNIVSTGNTGVLVAVAKACLRLRTKQTQYVNSLESVLKCTEADKQRYLCIACLRLTPIDNIDVNKLDDTYFIHVHGSVILQTLLEFQRPGKLVKGLLELSGEELLVILCDAKGCHVADAFCKSECVGVKARDKLIWKMKGFYQKLALSQYGSRAFDQIFTAASLEQKIKILTELSDKSSLLNSTLYGRQLVARVELAEFIKSRKQWENKWREQTQ